MNRSMICMLWVGLCFAAYGQCGAEWRVWTTTDTRRVLRDETGGSAVEVRLAVARNQSRGFQIFVRSDEPIAGVGIEPGDLKGPGQNVIRAADARLYRQHQFELTHASVLNKHFTPGWYPDALIPFDHPLTRKPLDGARLAAMPFDLPAQQTHGFWVDLYAPPQTAAGEYRGVYRVTAKGGKTFAIPVVLTVWDFQLPMTPTMRTALGSPAEALRSYYRRQAREGGEKTPTDWAAVDAQCAELLARHRINAAAPKLVPAEQADGTFVVPDEQVAALREFVDRYHINAVSVLHPRVAVKDPVKQRDRLRAWLKSFDEAAVKLDRPKVLFYTYLRDEPNDAAAYKYVQTWGPAIREAHSVVKVLVVEQPDLDGDPAWGNLFGAVDIWCPLFPLAQSKTMAERLALGETVWTYTALCQRKPMTPWWQIDFPLLHYRVPSWIAWRYGITGLLYWGGMAHWSEVADPWSDPHTYGRKSNRVYNGEGSLLYPGRAAGYDGVAPSLRLKALRDSIDDYEYLAMADQLGRRADAEKVVLPLAGSWFQWDTDPAAYDRARVKLAEIILVSKSPARATAEKVWKFDFGTPTSAQRNRLCGCDGRLVHPWFSDYLGCCASISAVP